MKKNPPCESRHPRSDVQCWLKQNPEHEWHTAMVKIEGTDRATTITWRDPAK